MNANVRPEIAALEAGDPENCNPSHNPSLMDVLEARLSRRGAMRVGLGTAGAAVLGAMPLTGCGGGSDGGGSSSSPSSGSSGVSSSGWTADARLSMARPPRRMAESSARRRMRQRYHDASAGRNRRNHVARRGVAR